MTTPTTFRKLFVYKGLRVSDFALNKGEGLPRHEHEYNHATMCLLGSCVIRKENLEIILTPTDAPVDLAANQWHEIEALEDNTIVVNIE